MKKLLLFGANLAIILTWFAAAFFFICSFSNSINFLWGCMLVTGTIGAISLINHFETHWEK